MTDSPELQLWKGLTALSDYQRLERGYVQASPMRMGGLAGSIGSLLLSLLRARRGGKQLLVVPDDAALKGWHRELRAYAVLCGLDPERIAVLEAMDADPYGQIAPHPEIVRDRVIALTRLAAGKVDCLLVPVRALLSYLPAPAEWQSWTRHLRLADEIAPDKFILSAIGWGYRRVDTVSGPGEVSRRGGIVDVFPPTSREPVRIEFFGDDVDSLRTFDTSTQRSTGRLDEILIGPATESPPTEEALKRVQRHLKWRKGETEASTENTRAFRATLERLENEGSWPGFETLARWTAESPVGLFDYTAGWSLIVDDPDRSDDALIRAHHDLRRTHEETEQIVLPSPDVLYLDPVEVRARLAGAHLSILEFIEEASEDLIRFQATSVPSYSGRVHEWVEALKDTTGKIQRTVCAMRTSGNADRVVEILGDQELSVSRWESQSVPEADPFGEGGIFVTEASIQQGFQLAEAGLTVVSENNLFGDPHKTTNRKTRKRAAFISDFRDLKEGDFVVHVDHGVAQYAGLGRPKGGSLNRDFMMLEFAAGDRLFVPVDRLDLVQKYSGAGGKAPTPDKLGGPGWDRVRRKAKKAVESMARELLELYAKRKAIKGHRYSPDTPWQAELEDAFPFQLTPDQERALQEIKQDMESSGAMDRLLVGDVGFGKTEVAVRCAFKAVNDGKQVAVLSPTTVLTMQHYETFKQRFAPFPVRVETVSRFRKPADVKKIIQELKIGAIDVLVGTHRMISKDVVFKNLGLLVVDEEQRFGVKHKERLKQLAVGMDVLSMSATPIPRTLQMSMAGVRDLSIIETPPPGRMAIQTYVLPFRDHVIGQAVRTELRREGQVYLVHNDIETLPAIAAKIQEMVPDARILTAHGQLRENELERIMHAFVHHEADVLVTTTIIENGLDIPNANTIIVNRADRFGLAQLYQLRGRVGRSREHAYAYFIVPSREHLSDDARKRIKALQEFSDLGAGFRLAAADLEIRGAGELLGARQHGHIASLGFDLYCQMLERAVQKLKGDDIVERQPVSLNLGVDIKVPETFLAETGDRLVLYKRVAQAGDAAEVDRIEGEIEDRFGHLPPAAVNLFALGRLRLVAEAAGVKSIDLAEGRLQVRFYERPSVDPQKIVDLLARRGGSLKPSGMMQVPASARGADRIRVASEVLAEMTVN